MTTSRNLRPITLATVLLAISGPIAAQPPPKIPPATMATRAEDASVPSGYRGAGGRVYVGEQAPSFELTSASEKKVKLSSFQGSRVLLCFTDRREAISAYRDVADSLRADSVLFVGIARDSPRSLRAVIEKDGLHFEMLSDPTGEVSAIYGSYDFATSSIRPGYVLVGRTGVVWMALLGQRLPPSDLLQITRYALAGL
jgi:peroxiredoxin